MAPLEILYVEDDQAVFNLVQSLLKNVHQGEYTLHRAATLAEGLTLLAGRPFDLALLDLDLPDSRGLKTLSHLRAHYPALPLVVLTGLQDEAVAGQILALGAQEYLNKLDLKPALLSRVIRYALERKQTEDFLLQTREELEILVKERTAALENEFARQKETETALRKSEERYRSILENIEDGYYECDLEGDMTFGNEAFSRITGYPLSELIGMNYRKFAIEKDQDKIFAAFHQVFATGRPLKGIDYGLIRPGGDTRRVEFSSTLIRDENGTPLGFRGIARDISELEWTRAALRESVFSLDLFIQRSPDPIISLNSDRTFRNVNPAFERILGFKSADLAGLSTQIIHPSEAHFQSFGQSIYPIVLEKGYWRGEWEFRKKDGTLFPMELATFLVPDREDGSPAIMSILRDISDRKEKEKALLLTGQIINSISSILVALDQQDRVVFWNGRAERELGIKNTEASGKSLQELALSWDQEEVNRAIARCRQEEKTVRVDNLKFRQSNGKDGTLGLIIHPIYGQEFHGTGLLIFGANVTQRRILETQLAQAQKLESIGSLAAGIAHEINTPTQYIGDNIRFLRQAFQDLLQVLQKYAELTEEVKAFSPVEKLLQDLEDLTKRADLGYLLEEIPRAADQTLEGVERVSTIVKSIKAFAHPGSKEKTLVDINQAIKNTLTVSRSEWKYVAEAKLDLDPVLPLVPCIPGDFNQVILNLIVNAAQAVAAVVGDHPGTKGQITIVTRRNGPWIEVEVRDTGTGIPEAIRSKIFDPFFTTKEVGKGTGQGLAICHTAVVDKHQGNISFETEPGRGTAFLIQLPLEG